MASAGPMPSADGGLGAWIDLSLVPALGPANYRSLLSAFGLPENVLAATHAQLSRVVPSALASAILSEGRADSGLKSLEWARKPGHVVLTLADERYPTR